MENNSNYNFNAYNRYYSALECVIFGEGSYAGVDPKTAMNMAKCCNLFYDIFCTSEKESGYWKKQVINQFKYKIDDCKIEKDWKNLFINYYNELNDWFKKVEYINRSPINEAELYDFFHPYEDSLSMTQSNAKAQYCYACALNCFDPNGEKAFIFWKLSADQGFAPAQNRVALWCLYGWYGDEKHKDLAYKYYQFSAIQENAEGQCGLADCYYWGDGVPEDLVKAFEYYQLSSAQGNAIAQWNLGDLYLYGYGTTLDKEKAFQYYLLSANQGNFTGLCNLAECYENGIGVDPDLKLAIEYYKLVAKKGSGFAQEKLKKFQ